MITESVKKILSERMHVVNEKLFSLAEYIYHYIVKEFKNGNYEFDFVLTEDFIKKYYPYNKPQPLKIIVGFDNSNGTAEYFKNKTILVNLSKLFNTTEDIGISKILHEIAHFVNDNEGSIKDVYKTNNETLNNLLYLLRNTECNARCSAFGYLLSKEEKQPLQNYENVTQLSKISKEIEKYKEEEPNKRKINKISFVFQKYKQKILKIYYSK